MAQLKLGLIGLGALGSRIATRLLRTGFSLEIYDIADVAVRMFNMDVGGIITGSPRMMAQACDVIITVLPSAADVREVAFGWEGLARGFARGGVLIDMGCSDPIATSRLAEELASRAIDMVDEFCAPGRPARGRRRPRLQTSCAGWRCSPRPRRYGSVSALVSRPVCCSTSAKG